MATWTHTKTDGKNKKTNEFIFINMSEPCSLLNLVGKALYKQSNKNRLFVISSKYSQHPGYSAVTISPICWSFEPDFGVEVWRSH